MTAALEILLEKAKKDPEAFGEIIDLFQKKLMLYVFRLGKFSREEAEDIVSESFLKAWRQLNAFRQEVSFSSWLYRIVHNETLSLIRKQRVRGQEYRVDLDENGFQELPAKIDVEKEFSRSLDAEKVRSLLDQLPEKDQTILVLFYLEEKSYEEISDILRIPSGTVATHLFRAKKRFREQAASFFSSPL